MEISKCNCMSHHPIPSEQHNECRTKFHQETQFGILRTAVYLGVANNCNSVPQFLQIP
ncbi:hypothetical protein C0J52_01218 [Blattella germanica]|nr:hypothetical protein C0J52_15695 [Blattella germanica]PSN50722.1 hypothetical protein C0J52_01218 [Blattella germanica]